MGHIDGNSRAFTARMGKASRIAGAMANVGISAQSARRMTELEWADVCAAIDENPPSEATKAEVIRQLEPVQLTGDPFGGF